MKIQKIFGPPGTGKTHALLDIMEKELAAGTRPDRLAYLSFTVEARRVAMRRATEQFKLEEDDLPYFKTLHAICYRQLGMNASGMVKGTNDLVELGNKLGLRFTYRTRHRDDMMLDMPSGGEVGDRLLQADHVRRHNLRSLAEGYVGFMDDDLNMFQIRSFVSEYERWKEREGLRDFTDLLELADEPLDIDVVIVDEAQDLSKLQWDCLHRLTRQAKRMYIAGDDDQAIFTWAGADPQAFLDHPGVPVVLGQSYRLPGAVWALAQGITDRIKVRQHKPFHPRRLPSGDTAAGSVKFAATTDGLPLDQGRWLILYRHHYLVEPIEEQVRALGVPYVRADRPAPGAEWGAAIILYERLRRGHLMTWRETKPIVDAIAMTEEQHKKFQMSDKRSRFTKDVFHGVGVDCNMPWYERLDKIRLEDRQYLRAIIKRGSAEALIGRPAIRLSTIHAAKGAQEDNVVVLTEMSRRTMDVYERQPDLERRVFYVGVTRAIETLTVVGIGNPVLG